MMLNAILVGGIAIASLTAALLFLRFWKATRDRLFLFFALSFGLEAVNRVVLFLAVGLDQDASIYYIVRLVSYGLIIVAIVEKNRSAVGKTPAKR